VVSLKNITDKLLFFKKKLPANLASFVYVLTHYIDTAKYLDFNQNVHLTERKHSKLGCQRARVQIPALARIFMDAFLLCWYYQIKVFVRTLLSQCSCLQRLLVCNPSGRLSAEEGLQHGYFSDLSPSIRMPSDPFWRGCRVCSYTRDTGKSPA